MGVLLPPPKDERKKEPLTEKSNLNWGRIQIQKLSNAKDCFFIHFLHHHITNSTKDKNFFFSLTWKWNAAELTRKKEYGNPSQQVKSELGEKNTDTDWYNVDHDMSSKHGGRRRRRIGIVLLITDDENWRRNESPGGRGYLRTLEEETLGACGDPSKSCFRSTSWRPSKSLLLTASMAQSRRLSSSVELMLYMKRPL